MDASAVWQAAVSVGRRVAQELGCEVGQEVGYAVRFEERTSRSTRITYLTGRCSQGKLVREAVPRCAVLHSRLCCSCTWLLGFVSSGKLQDAL